MPDISGMVPDTGHSIFVSGETFRILRGNSDSDIFILTIHNNSNSILRDALSTCK